MTIFLRVNYEQNEETRIARQERIASMRIKGALKEKFDTYSGFWLAVDTPEQGREIALNDDLCAHFFMNEVPSNNPYDDSKTKIEEAYIVDELIPYSELREGKHDHVKRSMLKSNLTHILVNNTSIDGPIYIGTKFVSGGIQVYNRSGQNITPTMSRYKIQADRVTTDKEDGVLKNLEATLEEKRKQNRRARGLDI